MFKKQLIIGTVTFLLTTFLIWLFAGKATITLSQAEAGNSPKVIGYLVTWDQGSFNSLKQNISQLDILMPEFLVLSQNSGDIAEINKKKQTEILNFARQNKPRLPIIPLINNYNSQKGVWDGSLLTDVLKSPDSRKNLINSILDYEETYGLDGISIDFENISPRSFNDYLSFLEELGNQSLKPVYVNIPLNNGNFDYEAVAARSDFVILMAYDQHEAGSGPGPIAALDWFESSVNERRRDLNPAKTIIALGNYGYDWPEEGAVKTLTATQAKSLAGSTENEIKVDEDSLNPTFDYFDKGGTAHEVWFLNAETAAAELKTTKDLDLYGYALWRLGSEDPDIWKTFGILKQ